MDGKLEILAGGGEGLIAQEIWVGRGIWTEKFFLKVTFNFDLDRLYFNHLKRTLQWEIL